MTDWAALSDYLNAFLSKKTPPRDGASLGADIPDELRHTLDRQTQLAGFMQTRSDFTDGEPEDSLPTGHRIGVWRIVSPLGEGGMGAVYLVERDDGQFTQRAALKLVKVADPRLHQQFVEERERLAALEHPGISRVIDGGLTDDNKPFMVVEYVDGAPLDQYTSEKQLTPKERLRLALSLCAAVSHAHKNLILHRDLKPSNVLVDEKGHVRLIDFGVAALMDAQDVLPLGPMTIAYAAPESFSQQRPTVALDIFSIGMLIFETLTGHLPHRNTDGSVQIKDPSLEALDLIAILERATALSPEDRYPSVDSLADDLQAYLDGRPVSARDGGPAYRAMKTVRRYPMASLLAAGFTVALIGGLISTSIMADRAQREAERANAARKDAEYALEEAEMNYRVTEAYGDALHRMFGGDGNTERMTAVLKERWQEAQDLHEQDPQHAAEITYAIGRNFIERNDYKTAIDILTPWVEDGYGDPRLLLQGELYLGLAHRYQGSYDTAEPMLEEVVETYAQSPEYGGFHHILGMITLAGVNGDQALIEETRSLAELALTNDPTSEEAVFYNNVLAMIAASDGDFSLSTTYNRRVTDILDDNPLTEIAGQDIVRVNAAMSEAFYAEDFDAARQQLDIAEQLLTEDKGESMNLAYIYDIRGVLDAEAGAYDDAMQNHQRAIDLALRFGGEGSDIHGYTGSSYAESLVEAGRLDEAKTAIQSVGDALEAHFDGRHTRYVLAKARVLAATEGTDAAEEWLTEQNMTDTAARRNINALFRYNKLVKAGVTFPTAAP